MSILKESINDLINESMDEQDEQTKVEYCFDTLDKLADKVENMQDVLDDFNQNKLKRYMKSIGLSGDYDDIEERVNQIKDLLDELIDDDLSAVLPGLEQQMHEFEEKE